MSRFKIIFKKLRWFSEELVSSASILINVNVGTELLLQNFVHYDVCTVDNRHIDKGGDGNVKEWFRVVFDKNTTFFKVAFPFSTPNKLYGPYIKQVR